MGHGAVSVFRATMASAASLTDAADLGVRAWARVFLEIPTMTSNTQHAIHGSSDGSSYRPIYFESLNSSTVGTNAYAIHSSVTNAFVPVPPGFRYLKVKSTATVDNGAVYKFVCSDEG